MSLKSLIEKMDTLTGASIVLNEGEDSNLSNSLKATVGDVEVHYEPAGSSGGILKVLKSGEEIADGDYDRGAGLYFVNVPGKKGQKSFDSCKEIAEFFANKNLDEDTKETPSGRVHKAKPGGYGRQFDTDIEGNEVATPLKQIVKRGRGRPRKDADPTGYVPKYEFATALQGWMVGNLPKGGLPGKPGVKHKLKDWMERVESAMLTEGYIAEGQMSEVYTILQDLAANGDIREAERLMINPTNSIEKYVGNVLMDYLDMVATKNSSASESDLGAMLMRKVDDEFGDTLEEVAGVINLPPTRVGGSQTQTNTVSVDGKAPAQASQQGSSNSTTALKITDPALMGLENIIQTALDKGSIKQLGEGAVNKFKSIVDSYPHEHKMCQEGWGMHESLYQALCDHYWGEGRIPHDKMYGDSQELRDWVEECYMEDAQQLNENPLVGAAVRGFASGAGAAMADRLLGDSMENTLDEMEDVMAEFKDQEVEESGLQAYLGKKKYGEKGMEALQKAGREGASKEEMAKIRAKYDKLDEEDMDEGMWDKFTGSKFGQKTLDTVANALDTLAGNRGGGSKTGQTFGKGQVTPGGPLGPMARYQSTNKNESVAEEVDTGEYAARKSTPSSKEEQDKVHAKHRERMQKLRSEMDDEDKKKDVAESVVNEKLTKSMSAGEIISDFVGSDDPKFKGKSKKERTKMALGAYYGMHPEKSKKKADEAKDPQMEAWARELDTLLNEGLTLTTSTGQPGGSDSVSVSATDEDAKTLMKLIQDAGLMKAQSGSMSLPAADNPAITIEPVSQDEVMGTLEPASDEVDSGDGALSFLKRMIGARGDHAGHIHGDYEQEGNSEEACEECGHSDCKCDHEEVGEMHNQAASSGDANMSALPEELHGGQKQLDLNKSGDLDAEDFKLLRAKGKEDDKVEEEALDQPATMEGDDWADAGVQDLAAAEEESANELSAAETEEDTAMSEGEETCNECGGAMYEGHKCTEELNEWANSPGGKSADEAFLADLTFMTKTLSGGLNNIKQDQTTVPSARVKSEERNVETSMAELMRKLQNIN